MEHKNWSGFKAGEWQNEINVRNFIQLNYKEYNGDADFLTEASMPFALQVFALPLLQITAWA